MNINRTKNIHVNTSQAIISNGKSKFIQLWLIISVIAGFSSLLFFVSTYINEKLLCDTACKVRNEVTLALILMSLFGIFIGSLTYYIISDKYEKKMKIIHKDISSTLRFLNQKERQIITAIISNNGHITQSKLATTTGFSRVMLSRCLKRLESKNLIIKTSSGMTNTIKLADDIKELFIDL
jgi:uncharacterized membrane protein